jgi:hypothetical protein
MACNPPVLRAILQLRAAPSRRLRNGTRNPGEIANGEGAIEAVFPVTLPSGQRSDFAGRVVSAGRDSAGFAVGHKLFRRSDTRFARPDHVRTDKEDLVCKPVALDWVRAGSLWAVGVTFVATLRVISGAAGGGGAFGLQLARRTRLACRASPAVRVSSAAEVDDAAHGVGSGAGGQGRADGPPERREQRGLVGAAGAAVAKDDEHQDRDADADDAEQGLEGQGDGADREHQQRAEPLQGDQVAGERAEDRADHDGAGQCSLASAAVMT